MVSGTTGMDSAQRDQLMDVASRLPVFWAPNMSIGVNLLLAALQHVAANLGKDYDVVEERPLSFPQLVLGTEVRIVGEVSHG